MTNPVVTDSTCLIGLERIRHLDILPALFEPVLIPPAVQQEFGQYGSDKIIYIPINPVETRPVASLHVQNYHQQPLTEAYWEFGV